MTKKITGLSVVAFLASIAGIVVSFMLLKEDVISTARTLFDFFPARFGVTPSASWEGAIVLGIFTSVLQIVSASVTFSSKFSTPIRIFSFLTFMASMVFDNWTDVVFRSGNLTGDVQVATITTLAFYTFGSEVTQSLSWLVFGNFWRLAISDIMWSVAKFIAGVNSISAEWANFRRAANNHEAKEREITPARPTSQTVSPQSSNEMARAWENSKIAMQQAQQRKNQEDYPKLHQGVDMGSGRPVDVPAFLRQKGKKQ